MAEYVENEVLWMALLPDLPLTAPGGDTAEEAATKPGNCVKSLERRERGFPKYHGRLLQYGDECVVIGHNSFVSPPFVWRGTKDEYHGAWEVD